MAAPKDKAAAAFKKQEQAREGAKAMVEYQADLVAEQRKIEKLRALRLAHEAAEAESAEVARLVAKPKAKPKARAKKTVRAAAPELTDS